MLDFLFYSFASFLIICAVLVVTLKNPIHSVLFLILAFFNTASLFILLGAEFISMVLIIVYVGAIAVLFLFTVMMLNIDVAKTKQGFLKILPFGVLVAVIFFWQIYVLIMKVPTIKHVIDSTVTYDNTKSIGMVLYTEYFLQFQITGIILLVAMIGAIVLTEVPRKNVKKQDISKQISHNKENSLEIVKVPFRKGVKVKG